jgi:hypothetical protein
LPRTGRSVCSVFFRFDNVQFSGAKLVNAARPQVLARDEDLAALCAPADLSRVVKLDSADTVKHCFAAFLLFVP